VGPRPGQDLITITQDKNVMFAKIISRKCGKVQIFGNESNRSKGCYYSVQNSLCCRLVPKILNIKIYTTVILYAVLYGRET
jgi:hypothetical protein